MNPLSAEYEVFAIRYAVIDRCSRDNFLRPQGEPRPTTMDYFIWVARNASHTVVIDTGFAPEDATPRGRTPLHRVEDGLAQLDIDPGEVSDVVLTHLHNDHAGGTALFTNARFHLQEQEIRYATGPAMRHPSLSHAFDLGDLADVIALIRDGRVEFHDGRAPVADGITGYLLGGHTMGTQGVLVNTRRGPVFLASDAAHYYENFLQGNPFPVLYSLPQILDGYELIASLVPDGDHIIPGHDPLVLQRYDPPSPELAGWIARLDFEPNAAA